MPKDAGQGWERQRQAARDADHQSASSSQTSGEQGFRARFSQDEKARIEQGRAEVRTRLFAAG